MKRLTVHPTQTGVANNCVPFAIAIATGITPDDALARVRSYQPNAATKRGGGTFYNVAERVLRDLGVGYRSYVWTGMPLHRVLAFLKGQRAILSVKTSARGSHAIAAHGFMIADNAGPTPVWWADFASRGVVRRAYTQQCSWGDAKITGYFHRTKPRRYVVLRAYVLEG